MTVKDLVSHQVTYLDYVLLGDPAALDAEVLRPVWQSLACLVEQPDMPPEVARSLSQIIRLVLRWMNSGAAVPQRAVDQLRLRLCRMRDIIDAVRVAPATV